MSTLSKRRKRQAVTVGQIRIPWNRYADGRTAVDFRSLAALPAAERRVRTFVDHDEALREAHTKALELHNSGAEGMQALTAADRAGYAKATADAELFSSDLVSAMSEWRECRRLATGLNLLEVVQTGVRALAHIPHPVDQVVVELMASIQIHDLHGRYEKGMSSIFTKFARSFVCDIREVGAADIESWLDHYVKQQKVGPRRRNNVLKELRRLFKFARDRGYLPDVKTSPGKVEIIKRVKSIIGILSPEAMALHLEHCPDEYLPWICTNAFSGVRKEEICLTLNSTKRKDPLRWEDFDWDNREIGVREETSKTGIPRRCPISDNLWEWLKPWRDAKATGLILPLRANGKPARDDDARVKFIAEARNALTADLSKPQVDLDYPQNGYRHSYASYRLALIKDMQKLSYEMGDSVNMIKRNYNNPRSESAGRAWFSLFPRNRPGNIIQLGFRFQTA